MKKIIFGFSRPRKKKLFAEAIMEIDDNNFSHGYNKFILSRWDADIIYQSSGLRTNFMGGEYFREHNVEVEEYEFEVPDETEAAIGRICVSREGIKYPFKMVIGIGLVRILAMVKIKIKNPFQSSDPDCIAEQGHLIANGLKIPVPFDFNNTTVKEFRDWLRTVPNMKRIK
jgi:hypothetical protein